MSISRLEKKPVCSSEGHLNIQTIPDEMAALQTFENIIACRVERISVRCQICSMLTLFYMMIVFLLCGSIIRVSLEFIKSFSG